MKTKMTELRYCETCGRVIQSVSNKDGVFWVHGVSEALFGFRDHEPVPVAESPKQDVRCDFCNNPGPKWIVPQSKTTEVGLMLVKPGESRTVTITDEEWAACDLCKEEVESATDPREFANWVLDRHVEFGHTSKEEMDSIRNHMVRDLGMMYRNLLNNMMPAIPINEYDEWVENQP